MRVRLASATGVGAGQLAELSQRHRHVGELLRRHLDDAQPQLAQTRDHGVRRARRPHEHDVGPQLEHALDIDAPGVADARAVCAPPPENR